MRWTAIGFVGIALLGAAGCGGGKMFANRPRPPIPINLSVYINDARVSVSPTSFGAGPVHFVVANQASRAESLQIKNAGDGSTALADTGPINPQATAEVTVDVKQGDYTVVTGASAKTDASQAIGTSIQPAHLRVGPSRANGDNSLLQP